jgi:signal transduction histidine kinase
MHITELGIGKKLIIFFVIGLVLLLFTIIVSNLTLNRIDSSKNSLTDQSIPALVNVNAMSSLAHELIESTVSMSQTNVVKEIKERKRYALESIQKLKVILNELKDDLEFKYYIDEIDQILENFESNLNIEYEILIENIALKEESKHKLELMNDALDNISYVTSSAKINAKDDLNNWVNVEHSHNDNHDYIIESFNSIEVISELISRSSRLQKDILTIEKTTSKSGVLAIQQDFDHSLRVITRAIVNNKKLLLRDSLGPSVLILIKHGQDSADIFDHQLNHIGLVDEVNKLHDVNFELTKKLNNAVNLFSASVKNNTTLSSIALGNTIQYSKSAFYVVGIISIILLVIIIRYVYKNIVVRLNVLAIASRKLLGSDLDFEIDTSGNDELSKYAESLVTLKGLIGMRKLLHEDLKKQTTLLQRSNEDLSLFAYVASHDLQEPLRVISSYSQLLSKRYKDKLDADADKFIDYMVSGCSRMESLIEGLLSLSRIDTNKGDSQSIWIKEILQQVKSDYQIKIKEKFALITWDEMPNIYADPSQIKTIFQNLISNALKYNESTPPKIHISAEKENDFWRFYVKDNGIGIREDQYKKIFVIFKRLHSRNKYNGTGIGLSMCKKIIERYGGEISVTSNESEGSTFIFTLPVDDRFIIDDTTRIAA